MEWTEGLLAAAHMIGGLGHRTLISCSIPEVVRRMVTNTVRPPCISFLTFVLRKMVETGDH